MAIASMAGMGIQLTRLMPAQNEAAINASREGSGRSGWKNASTGMAAGSR